MSTVGNNARPNLEGMTSGPNIRLDSRPKQQGRPVNIVVGTGKGISFSSNVRPILQEVKNYNSKKGVATFNKYAGLVDEEDLDDSFDVDLGIWESEKIKADKFFMSNLDPSDDEMKTWSKGLKEYYASLVDEANEVESEENEIGQDMKI